MLNALGYITTIGNHEFDDGPKLLKKYFPQLKMPVVCANIDYSKNPDLGKLFKPYHIFEEFKIGVIGYITPVRKSMEFEGEGGLFRTCLISSALLIRQLEIFPTLLFLDPIPIVQKYIDELEAKGIKRIIALGHNGYGPDMELAAKTRGLDLIVGGHSHSYLGDPQNPLYQGPFPTIIKNLDGENTLIVQVMVLLFFLKNILKVS